MKLPKHKCSLEISHNRHKSYYESITQFLDGRLDHTWQSDEHRKRAIEADEIWEMQWYPDTPIGFHRIAAPTLEELLAFSETFE